MFSQLGGLLKTGTAGIWIFTLQISLKLSETERHGGKQRWRWQASHCRQRGVESVARCWQVWAKFQKYLLRSVSAELMHISHEKHRSKWGKVARGNDQCPNPLNQLMRPHTVSWHLSPHTFSVHTNIFIDKDKSVELKLWLVVCRCFNMCSSHLTVQAKGKTAAHVAEALWVMSFQNCSLILSQLTG